MSSILDALERAEKERKHLDKKTLMDTGRAVPGLLQRRGLWLFAGALLLINLLIWFGVVMVSEQANEQPADITDRSGHERQPLATADTVVSILQQPHAGKQRMSDPPLVVEARVPEKHAAAPSPEPRHLSADPEPQSVSTDPEPSPSSPVNATSQPAAKVAETQTPEEPLEPTTSPAEVARGQPEQTPIEAQGRLAKVIDPQPAAEPPAATLQPEPEQEESEQLPMLWELPANVQEKLSDLKINILVYDEDAAQRFVIINMRKYHEGDRLVPSGMRLERITRKGVVIDYGDGLVGL
jgi:general secretion pathway protein B